MDENPAFSEIVNQNESFCIELPGNPSTGYRWQAAFEEEFAQLVDKHFQRTGNGMMDGGVEIFQFQAVKTGETKIIFEYRRRWEAKVAKQRIYTIIINPKKE